MRIEFWCGNVFGGVRSEWGDGRCLEQAGYRVMAGFRIFGIKPTGTVFVPLSTGGFMGVYTVTWLMDSPILL